MFSQLCPTPTYLEAMSNSHQKNTIACEDYIHKYKDGHWLDMHLNGHRKRRACIPPFICEYSSCPELLMEGIL